MIYLQRYWPALLIITVLVVHAVLIGYMRVRVASLTGNYEETVEVGLYRFQNSHHPGLVYQFRMHALVEPARRHEATQLIQRKRVTIQEEAEQLLRQVKPEWLADPSQTQLRDRLLAIILQQIGEPAVSRVTITDWLELPVGGAPPEVDLAGVGRLTDVGLEPISAADR